VPRGDAEAHHEHESEHRDVPGRDAHQRETDAREEHRRRQDPAPRDLVGEVAEERLDQGRGEVADEDDRRRRRVRQAVRVPEERQHRGERALVQVDDEMTEGQERDQLGVGFDALGRDDERGGAGLVQGRRLRVSHDVPMVHYSSPWTHPPPA
jgi:hypothetical protein